MATPFWRPPPAHPLGPIQVCEPSTSVSAHPPHTLPPGSQSLPRAPRASSLPVGRTLMQQGPRGPTSRGRGTRPAPSSQEGERPQPHCSSKGQATSHTTVQGQRRGGAEPRHLSQGRVWAPEGTSASFPLTRWMSKWTSEVCSKPAPLLNFKGMSSSRVCVHARRPRLPRHSGEPRFSSVPLPAGHRASPGGGALASLCQAGRRTPWCSGSRREEVCMGGVGRPTSHFPRPG